MSHKFETVRVGLFFILGLVLIWIVFQALGDGTFMRDKGYVVTAQFDNLKLLKGGDDVRMAGVKIGSVRETRLANGKAETVLQIDPDVRIPKDAVATIAMAGLLGTNFVAITVGDPAGGFLAENDQLETITTPDLDDVLVQVGSMGEKIEDLFSQLNLAIASIIGDEEEEGILDNLNHILTENRTALNQTLTNVHEITEQIRSGEGTLGKFLYDDTVYASFNSLGEDLNKTNAQIQALLGDAQEVVKHVRSGEGTLGALLYDESMGTELKAITANLRQLSEKLVSGEGTLGRLLADDSLYVEAQALLKRAERTIDGLGDQGPITAVGIAANALF